jgi:hypothetical protein
MNLGLPPDKLFSEDIKVFRDKLEKRESFTFSKFADGEWLVMEDKPLNNNEFSFYGETQARDTLIEAFQFKHPQYYVGISCPCCQGQGTFEVMKKFSGQPEERLTWANLWVNTNYQYYLDEILPLYSTYNTVLVAHKNSNLQGLPFVPTYFVGVDKNAWINNVGLIDELKELTEKESMKGWLFLFCCGPFGNILSHQLTQHNSNNTYLDIGSTLNPMLGTEGFRRDYFARHQSMRPCVWG